MLIFNFLYFYLYQAYFNSFIHFKFNLFCVFLCTLFILYTVVSKCFEPPFIFFIFYWKIENRCSNSLKHVSAHGNSIRSRNGVCTILMSFKVNLWSDHRYSSSQYELQQQAFL